MQLVILVSLFALTYAQLTCDVQFGSPIMSGGALIGKMKFVQAKPAKLFFDYPAKPGGARKSGLTEFYDFNWQNGWDQSSPSKYAGQNIFRTGTGCVCETSLPNYGAPILLADDPDAASQLNQYFQKTGTDSAGCTIWERKSSVASKVVFGTSKVSFDKSNNPCSATIDGKSYKFSNCKRDASLTRNDRSFTIPTDCKCGKPIDIALVLDRSGSISKSEWMNQRDFVFGFASQWEYDPLKANLAIINFQGKASTHLPLLRGVSSGNVNASLNALGCSDQYPDCDMTNSQCKSKDPATCCCCCGTCISCGIAEGGVQLATSSRKYAYKLLITVTDGYQNHVRSGQECGNDADMCTNDIKSAISEVRDALRKSGNDANKIAFYAIGVGVDRQAKEQLFYVADQRSDRVLLRANFQELARNNLELIQLACDAEEKPCGDCCGACICGKCNHVDVCNPINPCNKTVVAGFCCAADKVENLCLEEKKSDMCLDWQCDLSQGGKCIPLTKPKVTCTQPNVECFNVTCNPSTGLCETKNQPGKNCVQCKDHVDCSNLKTDACVSVVCVANKCESSKVDCNATLTKDKKLNACNYAVCDPVKGCITEDKPPCDDNNVCTQDICDPDSGCVFTDIPCTDNDPCTDDLCDPIRGCIFVPFVCGPEGKRANGTVVNPPCTTFYCNKTNGTCVTEVLPCGTIFPYPSVIAGSIGAVALAGIIIAAVILLAGAGAGGAYAYVQANGPDLGAGAINNPMYKPTGLSGENPLFRA